MTSPRKLTREFQAYSELRQIRTETEILSAFQKVTQVRPGKSPVHSPLSYLTEAIDDVLKSGLKVRVSDAEKAERQAGEGVGSQGQRHSEKARESAEDMEWDLKKRLFIEFFPEVERRDKYIHGVVAKLPWKPSPDHALNIAVSAWASETGQSIASMSH